jgi:Domain of unknown function (DUF1772)
MILLLISSLTAIGIAGFMVGNEIAVGVFVHPKLWTLSNQTHLQAVQPLAQVYGAVMPFWYAGTLLSSIVLTYQLYGLGNAVSFQLGLGASILWLLSILYTLWGPAPINAQVAEWNVAIPPADWLQQRRRWDRLHQWRVVGLIIAFVLITLAGLLGMAYSGV